MNRRENLIRAYTFNKPDTIPIAFGYGHECVKYYDMNELENLMEAHKILFPNFEKGKIDYKNFEYAPEQISGIDFIDSYNCVWRTITDGMIGAVTKHPLSNWENLNDYTWPDPAKCNGIIDMTTSWGELKEEYAKAHMRGELTGVSLEHGHTFLRLEYLRGYQNLIFDMHDDEPLLQEIIKGVENFSLGRVDRLLELNPDIFFVPEDLGMQSSPMLSPNMFRKYIKPTYKKIADKIKQSNSLLHMHSDGYIMDLIDDLIDCSMDAINMQDLVNGIDNIAKHIKGRVAIDLDIDRQNITINGTPKDCDDLIHEAVDKLGSKEGGLSLVYQMWSPTPTENANAIMDAMEKYCTYYS